MDTKELIVKYLEASTLSEGTMNIYKEAVKKFFSFTKKEYFEINRDDVQEWFKNLRESGYANRTIMKLSCGINSFFRFCRHQGLIKDDPTLKPKTEKTYWVLKDDVINEKNLEYINEHLLNQKIAYRSQSRITAQRQVLKKFFLENNKPVDKITKADVLTWIKNVSSGIQPSTLSAYISCLNIFFSYCLDEGYITQIPIKKRWKPKVPMPLPKALDQYDYSRVKLALEELPIRDRAIVMFFLSSGCREAEVAGLNIDDIDLKNRVAVVLGKGQKTRIVHFSVTAAFFIEKYLETRTKWEPALFLSNKGYRISKSRIRRIISNLGKKAVPNKNLSPHVFRHTFATALRYKGAELGFIAEELGHQQYSTTLRYAKLPSELVIKEYKRIMG